MSSLRNSDLTCREAEQIFGGRERLKRCDDLYFHFPLTYLLFLTQLSHASNKINAATRTPPHCCHLSPAPGPGIDSQLPCRVSFPRSNQLFGQAAMRGILCPGYFWYYTLRKDNGGGPLVVNWPVICTLLQQSSHLPRPVRVQQLRSCLSILLVASYSSENLTESIPFHRIDTQTYTTHQAKLYCSSRLSCVGTAKPAILTVHARCLFHPPSPLATAIPEPNNPDNTTCLSPEHIGFYDQRWSIPHSNTSSHAGKAK